LPAAAQTPPIPEQVTITASALPGTAIDPDKIPVNIQTLSSTDLTRFGTASTLGTLVNEIAGVSIANAQANPYQPNLLFRGFEASPLAGDAQGLAVYANGARLNQPFGDTLNWELIPDVAIDSLTLEGSNPVFGLNAPGGSLAIQMKNGFKSRRRSGNRRRFLSPLAEHDSIRHGDRDSLSYRGNAVTEETGARTRCRGSRRSSPMPAGVTPIRVHLNLVGALTKLPATAPRPSAARGQRSAVFTYPDETKHTYGLNLFGTRKLSDTWSVQGNTPISAAAPAHAQRRRDRRRPRASAPGVLCLKTTSSPTSRRSDPELPFRRHVLAAQQQRDRHHGLRRDAPGELRSRADGTRQSFHHRRRARRRPFGFLRQF
jgi:hypothetical protein